MIWGTSSAKILLLKTVFPLACFTAICLSGFFVAPAFAQLGGEQIRGDLGLNAGTQAPPGWCRAETVYFYRSTGVTGQNGAALPGMI